jgi:hypothetical protein
MHRSVFIGCLTVGLATSSIALAQTDGWNEDELASGQGSSSAEEGGQPEGGPGQEPPAAAGEAAEQPAGPETPIKWFVGLHGRLNWVPPFFQKLFLDKAPAVVSPGFNLVGTHRSDSGLSVVFGLGYISYAVEGPYRDKGDPEVDTEYIDGNLGLAHATASLLWSTRFESWLALEYGFGIDLGIVTGELVRTEAYPDSSADGGWSPCNGPGNPPLYTSYCQYGPVAYDQEGEHYGVVEERIPPVMAFPSIPHLALRFEPDPHLAFKLELAYGIVQFWFGLSAHYGFES